MAQKGVRNIGIPEPKNVIILVVTIASSGILGRGGGVDSNSGPFFGMEKPIAFTMAAVFSTWLSLIQE